MTHDVSVGLDSTQVQYEWFVFTIHPLNGHYDNMKVFNKFVMQAYPGCKVLNKAPRRDCVDLNNEHGMR